MLGSSGWRKRDVVAIDAWSEGASIYHTATEEYLVPEHSVSLRNTLDTEAQDDMGDAHGAFPARGSSEDDD